MAGTGNGVSAWRWRWLRRRQLEAILRGVLASSGNRRSDRSSGKLRVACGLLSAIFLRPATENAATLQTCVWRMADRAQQNRGALHRLPLIHPREDGSDRHLGSHWLVDSAPSEAVARASVGWRGEATQACPEQTPRRGGLATPGIPENGGLLDSPLSGIRGLQGMD